MSFLIEAITTVGGPGSLGFLAAAVAAAMACRSWPSQRRRVLAGLPRVVWGLGREYLLGDAQVAVAPGTELHHDATTWNTAAQVMHVQQIARERPPRSSAIVASRLQMPRIGGCP